MKSREQTTSDLIVLNDVITVTNLGLPDKVLGTSGEKFLRTASNIQGLKGLPVSVTAGSFFELEPWLMSNSETNSANAVNVG